MRAFKWEAGSVRRNGAGKLGCCCCCTGDLEIVFSGITVCDGGVVDFDLSGPYALTGGGPWTANVGNVNVDGGGNTTILVTVACSGGSYTLTADITGISFFQGLAGQSAGVPIDNSLLLANCGTEFTSGVFARAYGGTATITCSP